MDYAQTIVYAAKIAKVPPSLLLAICMHETGLKNVINPHDGGSASIGICQIKLATAQSIGYKGTAKGLLNPKMNSMWAGKYLKKQMIRYKNNLCMATAAFNAGRFNNSLIMPGYPRNLKYVRQVQKNLDFSMRSKLSCKNIKIRKVAYESD